MARKDGLFITFEGGEGSGKTTVIKRVKEELEKREISVLTTREPGGSRIAEQIRNIILDKENTAMDSRMEALLFAASRRQHLVEIVEPALHSGVTVLSDRYVDSSLAYQGYARGIGIDDILTINNFAIDHRMPDLTFLLDLKPEEGLDRINKNRQEEINRLDLETMSFHQKVYDGYHILLERFPERIVRIDASKSVEEETEEIVKIITEKLRAE